MISGTEPERRSVVTAEPESPREVASPGMTSRAEGDKQDVGGLWVPIVTPFDSDGSLDLESLRHLADRLLAEGVAGLVALGTTGEPATMTLEERVAVVEVCNQACVSASRPLMVGVGTNNTETSIHEAQRLGSYPSVAAVLVVVPYYTRPSEQAIVEHFEIVADESPAPVVMYNIPYRTGRGLDAEALLRAGQHDNIVGLKQAVGGIDVDTLELLSRPDTGFAVLAGDDAFIAPTMLLGGAGAIAAAAHLCTAQFVEMARAAQVGKADQFHTHEPRDAGRATELARRLLPVVRAGFAEPSPAVWKGALARRGTIDTPYVRRPMTVASSRAIERLLSAVRQAEEEAIGVG